MKTSIVLTCVCVCMLLLIQPGEAGQSQSKVPQICAPGSTFKEACNTCNCNDLGTSKTCTRELCDP
ncbi:serine protease inhibitor I/II-like [Homalodisca vitripennis]|uniref:serine protease inhibitor I/II-like n=1 Tax=Homalodisca vitripennis TaxID=197043 RepID=UPI001EEC7F7F|nr:serine protease inhibitor I/II-like [Homalodisca vitripennis]